MTTPNTSAPSCAYCVHNHDEHVLALVLTFPAPMGVMLCPDCHCGSTWRAGTQRSTPAEVAQTRQLVRAELVRAGVDLPEFLR